MIHKGSISPLLRQVSHVPTLYARLPPTADQRSGNFKAPDHLNDSATCAHSHTCRVLKAGNLFEVANLLQISKVAGTPTAE